MGSQLVGLYLWPERLTVILVVPALALLAGPTPRRDFLGPLLSKYSHPQNPFGSRILRVCCDVSMM